MGNAVEWSEGKMFKVDALAGFDALAGKCTTSISEVAPDEEADQESASPASPGEDGTGALSLEQIISSKVTREQLSKSEGNSLEPGENPSQGSVIMGEEGVSNTFYGNAAGNSISDNRSATFIGAQAGYLNTSGLFNTFIGSKTGYKNTTGDLNTFLGQKAGYSNTTGSENTFIGRYAGYYNDTGDKNTFIGLSAGLSNTTSSSNTFIGVNAGHDNTIGYSNTFIGRDAGYSNTIHTQNTFIGRSAGYSNTRGYYNTFLGANSGHDNISGESNTFLGRSAGYKNTSGTFNTFIGRDAGYSTTTGSDNTFMGRYTGYFNDTGDKNTFLGRSAGFSNTIGIGNVFIGYRIGYNNEEGSNRLYIDNSDTDTPLIYGEFDNNIVKIHGTLQMLSSTTSSDKRLKRDIKPLESSLDKVLGLKGVSYNWKTEEYPDWGFGDGKQIGLIAQDVEAVIPELVSTDKNGYKSVSYQRITAVLVEAIKELKAENQDLKEQLKRIDMEQRIQKNELRALLNKLVTFKSVRMR